MARGLPEAGLLNFRRSVDTCLRAATSQRFTVWGATSSGARAANRLEQRRHGLPTRGAILEEQWLFAYRLE